MTKREQRKTEWEKEGGKNIKKGIDKRQEVWYLMQAVWRESRLAGEGGPGGAENFPGKGLTRGGGSGSI